MSTPRVLILGGTGQLGHKFWQIFRTRFETWVTARLPYSAYEPYDLFECRRFLDGVDVLDFDSVVRAFAAARPDVAVNTVGVVKQVPAAKDPLRSLSINS